MATAAEARKRFAPAPAPAWKVLRCPACGSEGLVPQSADPAMVRVLRCASCDTAVLDNGGALATAHKHPHPLAPAAEGCSKCAGECRGEAARRVPAPEWKSCPWCGHTSVTLTGPNGATAMAAYGVVELEEDVNWCHRCAAPVRYGPGPAEPAPLAPAEAPAGKVHVRTDGRKAAHAAADARKVKALMAKEARARRR